EHDPVHADRSDAEHVKQTDIQTRYRERDRDVRKWNRDLRTERVNDHRHQRGHRGDHGSEEVDEACRFVWDDVFFKNELEQVCEWLQHAAVADAVWAKASLDETQHAALGQHRVGDDQKHDRKRHGDGYELEDYIDRSVH